ncbi:MAG: GPI mannosyltransferase 2 [Benjaminiella poitrasii]|nr:MAG: GPI mannosyltransferase 2 [Benjaminiella poitrasii]
MLLKVKKGVSSHVVNIMICIFFSENTFFLFTMLKEVYAIATASRLVTIGIAIVTYRFVGSYDSSAEIQLNSTSRPGILDAFLRWDALYFLHIAEHGYVYEQETAFFPVMPLLARLLTKTVFYPLQSIIGKKYTLLLSGITISNIAFILAACSLYKLTLTLLPKNKKIAMVSSIAFCLSPSAMFMSSFYTESLFAFLSFTGMRWVAQKKYLSAAMIWGATSAVRSNAIVYSGFFFYDLVWTRFLGGKNFLTGFLRSVFYTLITCVGFGLFQYYGYNEFCAKTMMDRPWCASKVPLLYSFVQKEYWNNGFLAYYELKQIPNFILAAPIILLSIFGLKTFIQHDSFRFWTIGYVTTTAKNPGYFNSSLLVYMYLWICLLIFVTTEMHVQVIIRFFTSLPPLYWFVGHLWIKGFSGAKGSIVSYIAQLVLSYLVLYGLIGIILFAAFLPPA